MGLLMSGWGTELERKAYAETEDSTEPRTSQHLFFDLMNKDKAGRRKPRSSITHGYMEHAFTLDACLRSRAAHNSLQTSDKLLHP